MLTSLIHWMMDVTKFKRLTCYPAEDHLPPGVAMAHLHSSLCILCYRTTIELMHEMVSICDLCPEDHQKASNSMAMGLHVQGSIIEIRCTRSKKTNLTSWL